MKKLLFLFCFISSIAFGQTNLFNTQTIGQTSRNQKVGKGLQVSDTLIGDGKVILNALRNNGIGVASISNTGEINFTRSVDTLYFSSAKDTLFFQINGTLRFTIPATGGSGVQSVTGYWTDQTDPNNPLITVPKISIENADPDNFTDNTQGYSINSIIYSTGSLLLFICADATTNAAVWNVASDRTPYNGLGSAPTVNSDITQGFLSQDLWYDNISQYYICYNNNVGAAVWLPLSSGSTDSTIFATHYYVDSSLTNYVRYTDTLGRNVDTQFARDSAITANIPSIADSNEFVRYTDTISTIETQFRADSSLTNYIAKADTNVYSDTYTKRDSAIAANNNLKGTVLVPEQLSDADKSVRSAMVVAFVGYAGFANCQITILPESETFNMPIAAAPGCIGGLADQINLNSTYYFADTIHLSYIDTINPVIVIYRRTQPSTLLTQNNIYSANGTQTLMTIIDYGGQLNYSKQTTSPMSSSPPAGIAFGFGDSLSQLQPFEAHQAISDGSIHEWNSGSQKWELTPPQPDWTQTDTTQSSYIKNKPSAVNDSLTDLTTGTVNLTNNAVNIITASGTITSTTFNFPTGIQNDEITVIITQAITSLSITGAGSGTVTYTPVIGTSRMFKNFNGLWY